MTPRPVLAVPDDVIRDRLVRSKTEWMFVLPHFSCHVVPPSQFIGKTVSVCVENKTTNSAECFCHKELDFGIGVIKLHQASNRAFGNERVRSTPSKRESTSVVACVEEDRVRLARSHCVLRHLCAFFTAKADPLSMSPLLQTESPVSQSACC